MLWVLNLCDGEHSLLDVAERSGLDYHLVREVAAALETHGLLEEKSSAGEDLASLRDAATAE